MSKQDSIEMQGIVRTESHGLFTVALTNGYTARATLCGRMRSSRIRVIRGDAVTVALSPYDLTRGIISYRHTPALRAA